MSEERTPYMAPTVSPLTEREVLGKIAFQAAHVIFARRNRAVKRLAWHELTDEGREIYCDMAEAVAEVVRAKGKP